MSETRYAFEQPNRFARGWHVLMFSQELGALEVKALHYFGRELVIYRGESGQPYLLDAYCPHLGTHLAAPGSKIFGDTVRCPFHGWRFNGCGECVDIPYAKTIPPRAKNALASWALREQDGFIAVWFDPDGASEPDWSLPPIEAWGPDACGDWAFRRRRVKTRGCEIVENIVDNGHFGFVHGGEVRQFDITFDKHTVTQFSIVRQNPEADMIIPRDCPFDVTMLRQANASGQHEGYATYHGPAIMYFYTQHQYDEFAYEAWWLNYYTPVDSHSVDLASAVLIRQLGEAPLPEEFVQAYPDVAWMAFSQDIEMWENKVYRPDPILCDGDGPITKLRKWYDQFYQAR